MTKNRLMQEYEQKRELYEEYAVTVGSLLTAFLLTNNFKFQVFQRAKDKQSLAEKIDRKEREGEKYVRLDDIQDLAGVRVVFYLLSHQEAFFRAFLSEFRDCVLSYETKYEPGGYRGIHLIFCLDKHRSSLVEYRKYSGLKCEIQVSTILYHAWSEVEHDIIYKPHGDSRLLRELGLDGLENSFQRLMAQHIQAATIQLDYLNDKYQEIRNAGEVLASDFVSDVASSDSNDRVHEILNILEDFCHRKPEETVALVDAVTRRTPIPPAVIHRLGNREIHGRSHEELALKAIELLSKIRYLTPGPVLDRLVQLSQTVDPRVRAKALEVIREFVQYNHHVLAKLGVSYEFQRLALDLILRWSGKEQVQRLDLVETVATQLLNTTVHGSELTSDDTVTVYMGVVVPNEALREIRRETMNLICHMYEAETKTAVRVRLVRVLNAAFLIPPRGQLSDDFIAMLKEDVEYLCCIYRKMALTDHEFLAADLSTVDAIDQALDSINSSDLLKCPQSEQLYKDILRDELYSLFSLLAGDPFAHVEPGDLEARKKRRAGEMDRLLDSMTTDDFEGWCIRLNTIAGQHQTIDDWRFHTFRQFLLRLAQKHPQLADLLLRKAIIENKPLKVFAGALLSGLRNGCHFESWDEHVAAIISTQDAQLVCAILDSLLILEETDSACSLRNSDLALIEAIVRTSDKFAFIKARTNPVLNNLVMRVLIWNYRCSQSRIEPLLVEQISGYPELLDTVVQELWIPVLKGVIRIEDLQPETIECFEQVIVELPTLDRHAQDLLLAIGRRDGLGAVLGVFLNRFAKSSMLRGSENGPLSVRQYEAIPYHFNRELREFISKAPDYKTEVCEWIRSMTTEWSLYNWHVSYFLERSGGSLDDIIMSLIHDRTDDHILMKVAHVMHSFEEADFDLSIEIVRRTSNRRVLRQVAVNMSPTGLVHGEYGIAEAFERKIQALRRFQCDKSVRVRRFVASLIRDYENRVTKEYQRADQEKQRRQIEFQERV